MDTSEQRTERDRRVYFALLNGNYTEAKSLVHSEAPSFVQFIDEYIAQHGLVRQTVLLKADIPVGVGYKYLNGTKRTKNRNTILRLCIAMQMGIEDTQKALSLYGMNALTETGRDNIITIGIDHRSNVDTIDEWLRGLSMEPLMEEYDR